MNCKQVIIVRKDLNMRKGKMAAQVAHASMAFLLKEDDGDSTVVQGMGGRKFIDRNLSAEEFAWLTDSKSAHAKVVVCVDSENELQDLFASAFSRGLTVNKIIDAGRTEFDGVPTLTCIAIGPHEVSKFAGLTDHLKLI